MSLKSILDRISAIKDDAETEVKEFPRETLAGRWSRQRNAKEELKTLKEDYRRDLLASSIFILVVGKELEQFTKTAVEEFSFFSADPDYFYEDLAERVAPVLYLGKNFNASILDVITRHLEDKAIEIGIDGYPMVVFKQEYQKVINSKAELVTLLKEIINTQVGSEVVGVQSAKLILDEAIKVKHSGFTTPVLLPLKDDKLLTSLLNSLNFIAKRVYVVDAGATLNMSGSVLVPKVTKETTKKAITVLRQLIQGNLVPSLLIEETNVGDGLNEEEIPKKTRKPRTTKPKAEVVTKTEEQN